VHHQSYPALLPSSSINFCSSRYLFLVKRDLLTAQRITFFLEKIQYTLFFPCSWYAYKRLLRTGNVLRRCTDDNHLGGPHHAQVPRPQTCGPVRAAYRRRDPASPCLAGGPHLDKANALPAKATPTRPKACLPRAASTSVPSGSAGGSGAWLTPATEVTPSRC
jgi:hypothetical protein